MRLDGLHCQLASMACGGGEVSGVRPGKSGRAC